MDNRYVRIAAVTAAVLAVFAVAALLVTTYRNASNAQSADPQATSTPVDGTPAPAGPTTPAPTTASPGSTGHDEEQYVPDAKTKAALADVTVRFLNEWKRSGSTEEREQRLRPYATEWLASRLANVDPAELPTARIDGRPQIVAATPYAAGTSTRLSDGLQIRCNLVLDTTGWRVAEVLPDTDASTPTPPAPTSASPSPSGSTPAAGDGAP
ncbi:hypothetical protein [Actinopolymorpha alba]|uniref:hypothetical protein n=1 Tax=Actinopolymorpha alba TaxID=533267 RepID=UPI000371A4BD|nr:hypothetical protein [Actinopolymorpha alba]